MSEGQPQQMNRPNQIVEKQLQEEPNFIAAVLDTIGAIVVVLDPIGRIVRFNRACETLTGYSSEEVVGCFRWDFLVPADQTELVEAALEQLRTGQVPNQAENHWLTKNGSRRLISWSNTTIPELDGTVKYPVGMGIDITGQRKQMKLCSVHTMSLSCALQKGRPSCGKPTKSSESRSWSGREPKSRCARANACWSEGLKSGLVNCLRCWKSPTK